MRIYSPDAYNEKKYPHLGTYFYAIIVGVILFFIILYFTKGLVWFIKLILSHWIYIGVGIIILLALKKFLGRKHMVVHQAEPQQQYQEQAY